MQFIILKLFQYWYCQYREIGLISRVFANDPEDLGSIPDLVITKSQNEKNVLDTASFNSQNYKVEIKDKMEQSREWSSVLPYTLV